MPHLDYNQFYNIERVIRPKRMYRVYGVITELHFPIVNIASPFTWFCIDFKNIRSIIYDRLAKVIPRYNQQHCVSIFYLRVGVHVIIHVNVRIEYGKEVSYLFFRDIYKAVWCARRYVSVVYFIVHISLNLIKKCAHWKSNFSLKNLKI